VIYEGHDGVFVRGSQAQLQRILINLLSNGICFAKSEVRVKTFRRGDTGCLRVSDDGDGIPERDIAHILTPWYTTGRRGGGLGLSVADRLAQKNGGRLDVASKDGAVFTVSFPFDTQLTLSSRAESFFIPEQMLLHEQRQAFAKRRDRLKNVTYWPPM